MTLKKNALIVVTGGAGFIGSNVIRQLNDNGYCNIVVVDDLGLSEKWKNLVGKKFIDILAKDQLFHWLQNREEDIAAIIHLGACSSTVEKNASYLLENNYRYSVKLAEYALTNNIRFIYASSAATYGDGSKGFCDDEQHLEALQPLNMYGYSKQLFDSWLKQQGAFGKVVGLKYFNVFGPNEGHKGRMASAIYHMLPVAKKAGVVRLFKSSDPKRMADGEQKRDFIYVKDAAKITCDFLNNDVCGIYNVGSGTASTWNALAKALFNALKMPVKIDYIDMPDDLVGKYQDFTCADMQKSRKALGSIVDNMSLENAVEDYVCKHLLLDKTH